MSRKLKDQVLAIEPDACHRCEQHSITKKKMHHVVIGNELVGYHARESWAWSQAWTWLRNNGRIV